MDLNKLTEMLQLRKKGYLDISNHFSVLLPLVYLEHELHILFEVRSQLLNNQPGEICFPGGRIEDNEEPIESAVRETMEELNISHKQIEILGELDTLTTPFNMVLYSFCGLLKDIDSIHTLDFNKQEVASVFTVPVSELLKTPPISYPMSVVFDGKDGFPYHLIENGREYKWKSGNYPVHFFQYKDHVIWGLTAKILNSFLSIISDI